MAALVDGAHVVLYSRDADADRAFLRDVLGLAHVDAGDGWLILALPPAEVAVHPTARGGGADELYLTCRDVEQFRQAMKARGVPTTPVTPRAWGLLTTVRMPGGGALGVYQPRHVRPVEAAPAAATAGKAAPAAKAAKAAKAAPAKAAKAAKAAGSAKPAPRRRAAAK